MHIFVSDFLEFKRPYFYAFSLDLFLKSDFHFHIKKQTDIHHF